MVNNISDISSHESHDTRNRIRIKTIFCNRSSVICCVIFENEVVIIILYFFNGKNFNKCSVSLNHCTRP